jgi:50S ribosomal protein L16 3-hydroxylase
MQLIHFDIDRFLSDHWQKTPLLIRNPWQDWANPLAPDELAGLACEDEVESRIIRQTKGNWALEHGPFPESRFARLGKTHWTLLVQAVDQHVPDVAALIAPFRFIPNWRIDDVMVTYAADEGGVGPHFDQYDVFLIQGLGRRRWQIGALCDGSTALLPHDDLRLLADFKATEEWVLEPGDILYVPPGVAHNGVAVGPDCMTYSVGFRAPSRSDLIEGWSEHLLDTLADDDRYADPDLRAQPNPGEISPDALARLHAMVTAKMADRDAFARWFGQHSSTPKYPEQDWRPDEPIDEAAVRAAIAEAAGIARNPAGRFSFVRQGEDALLLFVDGQCFECGPDTAPFAEELCATEQMSLDPELAGSDEAVALIAALLNQGSIAFDEDEFET